MAKVAFSKFGLKINTNVKKVKYQQNDEIIDFEIKEYLTITDKNLLISNVINESVDDNGFYNPLKIKIHTALQLIYFYTNINFTDKMKNDSFKLYDTIISSGLYNFIIAEIDKNEIDYIENAISVMINNIYTYKNSAMGIIENISSNYSDLSLEASSIQEKLAKGDKIEFLQEVMNKLG